MAYLILIKRKYVIAKIWARGPGFDYPQRGFSLLKSVVQME